MLVGLIIACEIAFWVILGAALTARYVLRMRRTSTALLVAVPLVDVVLLVATVLDLRGGATADFRHGLSAAYIGFSVAYGHYIVRWADARFAHRFAGGPAPVKPPKYGRARAEHEWKIAGMTAVAAGVAAGLLQLAIWWIDESSRTGALTGWQGRVGVIAGINALFALSYTLWPKAEPQADEPPERRPHTEKHLGNRR